MAFEILPADKAICDTIDIRISANPDPIDGGPPGFGAKIPLQFPPKFMSDGKSANWKQVKATSYEPVIIYQGSNARAISIEITYINDGDKFKGSKIADIEKMIKAYFYRRQEDSVVNSPMIEIRRFYSAVHPTSGELTTWRAKDVDIQHGDGIILAVDGSPYPLSSKVTLNLETYTQLGGRGGDAAITPGGGGGDDVLQAQSNLEKIVKKFWY
jgi:hypothetical protein